MKRAYKGFTLIELLVVIAIIGLLSTLAVVALNSARQRSRDAKRVADIRQIQTALELGFSETQKYPSGSVCGDGTLPCSAQLGSSAAQTSTTATILCKDKTASANPIWTNNSTLCATTYMGLVPANPSPNGVPYTYVSPGASCASPGACYSVTFNLEGNTGQLSAGNNCANSNGIIAGAGC